jgi:tetratricopeptide (TPR) repeat protein/TolB-like protein
VADVEADHEGVNQALARLLAWPEIARSPQLANFLTYIVERRLRGDAHSIKAYSIAVDVFGRAPDFDPQADPIVRVQARRLRGLLDQYYRGPGSDDPLHIQLPIGRYVPEFVDSATEPSAHPIGRDTGVAAEPAAVVQPPQHELRRGHVNVSWFVLLVLTLGAIAMTYSLATLGPRREQQVAVAGGMEMPRLKVMEFQNLTGDRALTPSIAALAVELVTDFEPLLIVDAVFGGPDAAGEASGDNEDFVLTGIVRGASEGYEFNAVLTDAETNGVVWNWSAILPAQEFSGRSGVDSISQELILRLGGTRGPLHVKALDLVARSDIAGQENFYLCGVLFMVYRTTPSEGSRARVENCFDALPEEDRANGNVLAARASIMGEMSVLSGTPARERTEHFARAEVLIAQGLSAAPTSSFVWEQRGHLHEAQGRLDEAVSAYGTALQLNSANLDATAAFARLIALMGRLDEAAPLARRAVEAVPPLQVPGWFYCVPSLDALVSGAVPRAARLAQDCGQADPELGTVLAMLAAHQWGDTAMVGQVLTQILEVRSFRSEGIMRRLEDRITDVALLGRIETVLLDTGVPQGNLDNPY